MNLEKCLNVHFAEERGFGAFALGVVDDDKKSKQFVQLIGKTPQQKRGEFWRGLLNAVKTHLSSQEEKGKQVEAVFSISILAINAWMDFNPVVNEEQDADEMEDEDEGQNTRRRSGNKSIVTKEQSSPSAPQSLLDLLGELHDSLFEMHDFAQVQDDIAQLCERWYVENRPMRERYLPQLIPTLLILSFETNVNRVFALRHTLRLFDFSSTTNNNPQDDDDIIGNDAEDEDSSQVLKRMLLKCFVSPVYLKSPKGRRVLTYIMSLSREMLFACHAEMLHFQTQSLEPFAQVYFGTWMYLLKQQEDNPAEDEDGEGTASAVLEAFETDIVQNEFVKGAIFYRDAAKRKLCLKMLDLAFHENKKEKRVDALLCKIYSPLVFTSLNATNCEVRRNAACLLFNAFPLHDPYSGVQEIAAMLDKQFLAMETLLFDSNPDCRACAADGVCRLLALFWETIPKSRCSRFLQILVNDLAFDKTSPLVRQSVLRGLAFMLDFPLCHTVLKTSLRYLKNHFHDRALQVRAEFCQLLGKLDTTVGFAFTDFVSLEDVLQRLVLDESRKPVRLLLCKLLLPLFFPKEVDNVEQLKRARLMATSNMHAARVFLSNLKFVCSEWNRIVKLTLLFGSFVNARRKEIEKAEEEEEGEEEDVSDVEMAISCICALWTPISLNVANNPQYQSSNEKLREMFDAERFLLPLWNLRRFSLLDLCRLIGPGNAVLEKKILKRLYVSSDNVELEVDLISSWNDSGECVERVLCDCIRALFTYLKQDDARRNNRLDETRAVKILGRIIRNQVAIPTTVRIQGREKEEREESDLLQVFDLARPIALTCAENRIANALLLLEIKFEMQREDDTALRWVLAQLSERSCASQVSNELLQGVFLLAADCVSMGGFPQLLDACTALLANFPLYSDASFHSLHLDRFVYRLLLVAESGEQQQQVLAEQVWDILKDREDDAEAVLHNGAFLCQWFQAQPHRVFGCVVFPSFLRHEECAVAVLKNLYRAKAVQVFACALDELERYPARNEMFEYVKHFATRRELDDKTKQTLVQNLVRFSDKIGGVLGDQVHNLASELREQKEE